MAILAAVQAPAVAPYLAAIAALASVVVQTVLRRLRLRRGALAALPAAIIAFRVTSPSA
jgi:hypothetical protein